MFNATTPTQIYTLSLHDALPISDGGPPDDRGLSEDRRDRLRRRAETRAARSRSYAALREVQPRRCGRAAQARQSAHRCRAAKHRVRIPNLTRRPPALVNASGIK